MKGRYNRRAKLPLLTSRYSGAVWRMDWKEELIPVSLAMRQLDRVGVWVSWGKFLFWL